MSKRMMTNPHLAKLKQCAFAFMLTLAALFTLLGNYTGQQNLQAQRLNSCMTVGSHLPMNHVNHPCHAIHMSNRSWLSWLSGESKSTHLHFLDLAELIHYSFH